MPRFPDWYKGRLPDWLLRQDAEDRARGTKVVNAEPWPNYSVDFIYEELRRYERDHKEMLDLLAGLPSASDYGAWNPHSLNTTELYRAGVFKTLGWFLGRNDSPANGFPGPP